MTRPDTKRIIFHIDFDSFFASVEQQCNPLLRNHPIGVTATNGRTCIIASSREAKRLGIGTGSRSFDALRICPEIKLVPADFWKYWEVSKKFISICKDFSPFVEVFSIDELFMDASYSAHLYGGSEAMVAALKKRIREEIGEVITVSVGIAHNKLLAKLASGLKKPNGMFYVYPYSLESVYQIAKLQDICGIGPRIAARLNFMGIYTLLQLRRTPRSSLIAEFGNVEGHFLYDVGQGIDPRPVLSYTDEPGVKSVGRQYCLPGNQYDKRVVLQNVYELCEEVCLKLRRLKKKARAFGVSLRGTETLYGHITYKDYADDASTMFRACLTVIEKEYHRLTGNLFIHPKGDVRSWAFYHFWIQQNDDLRYVRQIGVWTGLLADASSLSAPLLLKDRKIERVIKVVDTLNDTFGDHTIRNGFLTYAPQLTTVPNGYMADRFERSKLARIT